MDKYDANNDSYCYPNTTVLKNKLDIREENILEEAERDVTSVSIYNVKYSNPPYDLG